MIQGENYNRPSTLGSPPNMNKTQITNNPKVQKEAAEAVANIMGKYSVVDQNEFVKSFIKEILFARDADLQRSTSDNIRLREHFEDLISNVKNI